ncbi:hypothetical protein D1013_12425 [Euzebyella marina]|uniref:Uncharacterized protein n=1 Tax=Euzebyella marina TaxID=1761453 RepID=A0A3G2L774_9FLAO|nr:hypothetical protein [Euzebyella marina]AYN68119.1 hypothetical protein D1013_12425 [Euzebyella marina]
MKKNSTFWALLFSGFGLVTIMRGQDTYFQEGSKSSETWAKSLTRAYQPELVLGSDQVLLFQKKLEEFLIRENKIQKAEMSPEDKMFLLSQLADQQRAEMSNILTRPQLRRYEKVKDQIQPVSVVVDTLNH